MDLEFNIGRTSRQNYHEYKIVIISVKNYPEFNRDFLFLEFVMIEIENLVKIFCTDRNKKIFKTAVDDISLSIAKNEIFGLLGPNGAGKTTIIKMLTGQLSPTSGKIFYDGQLFDKNSAEIKKILGVVPQHLNFDQELNVEENLQLHAKLYHLEKSERIARINFLLDYFNLSDYKNFGIKKLSGGMKRRLLIARALIHRPKIIFLDEPTVALDPQVRRKIWDLIENLSKDGVTIFLTTHYIEEAENLCNRTAIINSGKLIAVDSPKNFCTRFSKKNLEEVFIELTKRSE